MAEARPGEPRPAPARPPEASDALCRAVLSSLPAQIAVLDRNGVIVLVNEAWERFARGTGVADPAAVGVGVSYIDVCRNAPGPNAEASNRVADAIEAVLAGKLQSLSMEYPCHAPHEDRWFQLTVTPLVADGEGPTGAKGGAVVTHLNVTDRKKGEIQLEAMARNFSHEQLRLEETVANVPGIVWEGAADAPGGERRIRQVNRFVEQLLGYPVAQWMAEPNFWLRVIHPDDRGSAVPECTLTATGPATSEFRCITRDGRALWMQSQTTVVADAAGAPVGVRGVAMDITARKANETLLRERAKELTHMARALRRSNEELDQFAYVTSHDLKAPLRGIANLSRWIEEDMGKAFTPEASRQMELLRGRVHRMENLIDGLLQYSRIGRVRAAREPVDTAALVAEVIDLLSPPAGFTVEVRRPMPTVVAERLRLQQVFMNLIGNAIKHHDRPDGGGRATVAGEEKEDRYEFSVADDGPGIAPQYHGKVFTIFQTLAARDKVEGTGIGLSLVRKIVDDAGGEISLESEEGKGAVFRFTWPKM